MLETVLLTLEDVHLTAEEDMKHMLSYVGYMALDCRTTSGVWKSKITQELSELEGSNCLTDVRIS